MFQNYIVIALRNLVKFKTYSFINIFGLAFGLSACLFMLLYVQDELSYDRQHPDADRLFRSTVQVNLKGQTDRFGVNAYFMGEEFKNMYPEIESHTVIRELTNKPTLWVGDQMYLEKLVALADSNFLQMFSFPLFIGDAKTALNAPNSAIVTEAQAIKFYGSAEKAMGKELRGARYTYTITGVMKDTRLPTHLPYNIYFSLATIEHQLKLQNGPKPYLSLDFFVYFKLKPGASAEALAKKMNDFSDKTVEPAMQQHGFMATVEYFLQPVTAIHLDNSYQFDIAGTANPNYVYIFGISALLVLFIACINYMNLSISRSARRAREVGVRKALGATRGQLIAQFLGESVVITLLALVLALAFTELGLPVLNRLTEKDFHFADLFRLQNLALLGGMAAAAGLLAGSYPAFYLSHFRPTEVLKGARFIPNNRKYGSWFFNLFSPNNLRRGMVTAQFGVSSTLIVGVLVVYGQLKYMKDKDLGFDKDQIYTIGVPADSTLNANVGSFKNEYLRNPNIKAVAMGSSTPGQEHGRALTRIDIGGEIKEQSMNVLFADHLYLPLLKIGLVQGENFAETLQTDSTMHFIVNETAARMMGMRNPVGKDIKDAWGYRGKIVGMVKDYHYASLHSPIEPLLIIHDPRGANQVVLKIGAGDISETVGKIDAQWKVFDPRHTMVSGFVDDNLDKNYGREERMLTILGYFSFIAVFISCLGLFGLAAHATEQRVKEIGVRKVLGASVGQIVAMLNREFLLLALAANIIAIPAAVFLLNGWLNEFEYHISLSPWPFLISMTLSGGVAALTVSSLAFQAARQNPVTALRYE